MFPKLQRKFVLLYTVTTGLITTLVLSAAFLFYLSSQRNQQKTAFQDQLFSLTSTLQSGNQFADSFLAQAEQKHQLLIYIEENDIPFFFSGSYQPATDREVLFLRAGLEAQKEGIYPSSHPFSSNLLQSSIFEIAGDKGDAYLGNVLLLQTENSCKKLVLLQDITRNRIKLARTACSYLLIDLFGILLLFFTGRWFVRRSLRPMEEVYKKQQDFAASASHELRSPLSVIQTSADAAWGMLSRPAGAPLGTSAADVLKLLETIKSECRRGSSLIKNLLLLVSAEQNQWAVKKRAFEIDTLLLNLLELYEPLCFSKNGTLLLELPGEDLPAAYADPDLCRQILTILLDNAITYGLSENCQHRLSDSEGGSCGKIILRGEAVHSRVSVSVIDHGPGIPDKEKSLIFDRFYKSDKSRNSKEHFGLGLSIAAALAELQGISLKITDTPGGGTTFVLILP